MKKVVYSLKYSFQLKIATCLLKLTDNHHWPVTSTLIWWKFILHVQNPIVFILSMYRYVHMLLHVCKYVYNFCCLHHYRTKLYSRESSVHTQYTTDCFPTCSNPNPPYSRTSQGGCTCPNGTVLDGIQNKCVPLSKWYKNIQIMVYSYDKLCYRISSTMHTLINSMLHH